MRLLTIKTASGDWTYIAPFKVHSDGTFLVIHYMGLSSPGVHMFPLELEYGIMAGDHIPTLDSELDDSSHGDNPAIPGYGHGV